ncbi:MAG: ADP-ribosylglycohydrolase family protein [Myxococcaceae bacterium]
MKPSDHDSRMDRVTFALDGLSLGDAFGEQFFGPKGYVQTRIHRRQLPDAPWRYTDDTEMALGIAEVLERHGHVDRDELAKVFARRFMANRHRGYGHTAFEILSDLHEGRPWRVVSAQVFGGQGSMGNGGAMRAAPVGAYFAGEPERVVEEARRSAEVTHTHPDGQAGAIAAALAAAWAAQHPGSRDGNAMLTEVIQHTPDGPTREGLRRAAELGFSTAPEIAGAKLGAGERVISSDTVPYALWSAARSLGDFTEAMWSTVSALGDRDTTCAIAGGIVALAVGPGGLPTHWLTSREALQRTSDWR